jgi:coproporphyrinogen III oxidase
MLHREVTNEWFRSLRDELCYKFENIEKEYATKEGLDPKSFERKIWERGGGGGGEMSLMRGHVFEKVGVNISTVYGEFTSQMQKEIPGALENPKFHATGISLVAHMKSPLIPAFHFNTRYIETTKNWFGGGGDMTPTFIDDNDTKTFHHYFKEACDKHDPEYYPKFKKQCDEYFYLAHRQEPRGIGGIFYDYHNNDDFEKDFSFTMDVGRAILNAMPAIIVPKIYLPWNEEQKTAQLIKRGRYVEFNLLYDRGTKFGLMTGGNTEAILMSLPPEVRW